MVISQLSPVQLTFSEEAKEEEEGEEKESFIILGQFFCWPCGRAQSGTEGLKGAILSSKSASMDATLLSKFSMSFSILSQKPDCFVLFNLWFRSWSNSSQVDEKNGSLINPSLPRGTICVCCLSMSADNKIMLRAVQSRGLVSSNSPC